MSETKPYGVCVVGGYSLHLYCVNGDHAKQAGQDEFAGRTKAVAFTQARKAGWLINEQKDMAYCPGCARRGAEVNQ